MIFTPRLLVTDDDSAFRSTVCEGLVRRGFEVAEARDGQEAIEVIGRTEVHVALVDMHMPKLSGLEFIRQLNRCTNRPPCVLMSADLDDEIRREAFQMCAYEVLSKPFRMLRLTEVLRAALSDAYGWSE